MFARSVTLWILALVITLASAYWQRVTGPSHPLTGTTSFAGNTVEYELTRSNRGKGPQEVSLVAPTTAITGRIVFKRYTSDDAWSALPLTREGDRLTVLLPEQPPAGKLEYYVELRAGEGLLRLPESGNVIARHTGAVSGWLLLPHVIGIFLAMLFAARAGLEALFSDGRSRAHTLWAFALMVLGGLLLGAFVQKSAFGVYWSGVPFGWDLTDNKTLIAALAWLMAVVALWNRNYMINHPRRRWWAFAASVVTLAVFLIPHSLFGSELDYSKQNGGGPTGGTATVHAAPRA